MGLDIERLKKDQKSIHSKAILETYEELPETIIQILRNSVLKYCLEERKTGIKEKYSARVINNWINNSILKVDNQDKGKIKRFNVLENIWLNIIFEARKFGMPLPILKQVREDILESPIKDFSLLKLAVFCSILYKPQILILYPEGNASITSYELYANRIHTRMLRENHIVIDVLGRIKEEFPQNILDKDLSINDSINDTNKLKMLYFLKTGDYQQIKIYVSDDDIRIIENSQNLLKNKELIQVISNWKFAKAEIKIDNEVLTIINP